MDNSVPLPEGRASIQSSNIVRWHIDPQENKVKVFSIVLLAGLITVAGCGDRATGNKTEAAASSALVEDFSQWKEVTPELFAETKKKAEAGDAQAQYDLGLMYETSGPFDDLNKINYQISGNIAKAVEWYQKSAAQGNPNAQYNLGVLYDNGKGVTKDSAKSVEWWQKAAAQGHVEAQYNLGVTYQKGEGAPKDAAKAVEWYQKAAAQGLVNAQYALGWLYQKGEGVPKDAAKAAVWWQKAAEQGNAGAQFMLGLNYAFGVGVPKDSAKAVEWYQNAAAQGHADAQAQLGWMYANGEGISKNSVLAYAWSNLAAAKGNAQARKNRDTYESRLTPQQRAEGQRIASNWKNGDTLLTSSDNPSGSTSPDGKPTKQDTGTAFAVSSEGHALTNHHVINGCTEVKISGREGIAKVITSDSINDLALLQLPGKTKDVANLNPDLGKLRQGEDIIVFGYPLDFVLSSGGNLTPGTISALTGLGNNTNQIQITAPIQPGSSGSPVMDKKGNVVGVVSMKLSDSKMAKATGSVGQNVNFAVNGQTVKAFLDANKVPYKTGGGFFSLEKSNADIAEEASKWTVLVECWK